MHRLELLGTIDLRDDQDRVVSAVVAQPKRVALLAYLTLASLEAPVRRDTVLGLLWPELDEERARNALSKGLHHLRHELGADVIRTRSLDDLEVDPTLLWSDVREFRRAIREDRIADALNLYRGPLLPGLFVSEAPAFEKWLEREGRSLRRMAADAARLQAERLFAAHRLTDAVRHARQALELAGLDERMLRRLLALIADAGDRSTAVKTYEEFATLLREEYGTEPSPETQALVAKIREAPSPPAFAPLPSGESRATDQLAASLADRYTIERELGAGGSAIVHLATDRKLQRKVAIKVLRPAVAHPMGADKFLAEILIAARLSHPHIVPLLDSGDAGGLMFYVMPWLTGESLRDRLIRESPLPLEDALRITRDVADALAYAHAHGVVHRDIKPENILLESGHALIADFGIARAIGRAAEQRTGAPQAGSGTPAYVSPEQSTGEDEVDGRGDIYSLGCVLFEMLTGRPPFAATSVQELLEQHRSASPPDIAALRPELPAALAPTIAKALAKDPADRFALADELGKALGTIEAVTAVRRSDRRRAVAIGVAVTLALLLGGGALAAWMGSAPLPPEERPEMVLADVDAAGDSALGEMLTAALRVGLTGSVRYQLVPFERTQAVLPLMGLPRNAALDISRAKELAIREGVPLVASVTVRRREAGYVLTGEVSDPRSREPRPFSITVDSEAVLLDRLDEVLRRLRVLAGDRERDVRNRPGLDQVTTSSLPALRLYAATVERANELWALEAAVRIDSEFASANRLLSIRYLQARRFSDSRRAFAAALRHRDRLTPVEQHLLDATGAALSGWTDTAAIRASNDAVLALDPQNWAGLVNRASHELWHHGPAHAEPFIARAMAIDSTRPGLWDMEFWRRVAEGDSAGAASALEDGMRLTGSPAPFFHEWAIYGWRFGDYSRVEYYFDSLSRIPGIADSIREDYPIIGSSVAFLRGRHREAEEQWAKFGARVGAGRGLQIVSSTIFRDAECLALAHRPPSEIQQVIAPRIAAIDLTGIEADERESVRNYLAGAWSWAGATDKARALLAVERRPDSQLIPWVLHTRVLSEQLNLVAEGRHADVIARDRTLRHSPLLGVFELPLALAYDRIGEEDSVLAAGERFFRRRTFIAIASDLGCAEQILRVRMGEILEARGDAAGARRHYERFLSDWPTPEPVFREQYEKVRQRLGALDVRNDRSR